MRNQSPARKAERRHDRSSPLRAPCRAQCRADFRSAGGDIVAARSGAGSGERDGRAYPPFRPGFPEIALAAQRPGAGGSPLDRGVAGGGPPVQPASRSLPRCAGRRLARGAGRRDPLHQHDPYQPMAGNCRAAARCGPAARHWSAAVSLRALSARRSRDRAEQRGLRRKRAIPNGGCAIWRRSPPRARGTGWSWTGSSRCRRTTSPSCCGNQPSFGSAGSAGRRRVACRPCAGG